MSTLSDADVHTLGAVVLQEYRSMEALPFTDFQWRCLCAMNALRAWMPRACYASHNPVFWKYNAASGPTGVSRVPPLCLLLRATHSQAGVAGGGQADRYKP